MTAADPPAPSPSRHVQSADGTRIAVFSQGVGRPIVLVHGAAADHTTFRVVGPRLAARFGVHELDRRGRGASGDGADYSIEREYEDVGAVCDRLAEEAGELVAVVGHSFGGRVGLGAALLTRSIGRLVVYEGAPPLRATPYQDATMLDRLRALRDEAGDEALLVAFLREVVRMPPADLTAYQGNPVWPQRVRAAPTILRELEAEASPAGSLERLGRVGIPVLQLLGGDSAAPFRAATDALAARLADGRVAVIPGARHAAHHTHPDAFVDAVERFLDES
jgi:pimeloyl-ACP methyl ester carboxylesterase